MDDEVRQLTRGMLGDEAAARLADMLRRFGNLGDVRELPTLVREVLVGGESAPEPEVGRP